MMADRKERLFIIIVGFLVNIILAAANIRRIFEISNNSKENFVV